MDSQSLTQLSQTSGEAQMRLLEIVLQIITLSTLLLFAVTLVIIVWLCLRELKQNQLSGPFGQAVQNENAGTPGPSRPVVDFVTG